MAIKEPPEPKGRETQFEVRRGVGRVSVEHGFAQIHLSQIPDGAQMDVRLCVLRRIAETFVNVRFPKFTPSGASFLVEESDTERVERALEAAGARASLRHGRSVISIHAPSIREEEGMTAQLVARMVESGVRIEHVADTHDRLMVVVETASVDRLVQSLESTVKPCVRSSGTKSRRNRRRIKILKFGGTSVATLEARAQAARKVAEAVEEGFMPVVVVSAIGRDGLPYATDTLIHQAREANPGREPDLRDLDLMLACGEILSAVIFAGALGSAGIPAHAFRGDQAGIQTDASFGKARIVGLRPNRIEESLREGYVPVVCGFQGCVGPREGVASGEVTTLGRGGSDTTAAALGTALGAEAIEIYTDVDGVMSADPRLVSGAKTLWAASYEEIASLAHLGAKVIHPRAVEIAMAYGVSLWVKNTFANERGTEIASDDSSRRPCRTGVAQMEGLVYLRFDLRAVAESDRAATEGRIFRRLAVEGVSVLMVDLSPTSVGLAIPKAAFARLEPSFDGWEASVSRARDCTMVSLVGHDYIRTPGALKSCLVALRKAGVETIQTNAVDPSMSFLVPEAATQAAVEALFEYHESMNDD